MTTTEHQVIIHIHHNPLAFADKADLVYYIHTQRKVAKNWQEFDHYPLCKVVDDQTGEEFSFLTEDQVPQKTLESTRVKNRPLLILKNASTNN
jgi:hypothetical protein